MSEENLNTNAVTPKARLMFPALFTPKAFEGQPEKYSAVLVFDKEAQGTAEFQKLKLVAGLAAKAKFGDKPPKNLRNPFRSGSEKETAGFNEDDVFISVTSKKQPRVVDRKKVNDKFPVITDEDRLYSGCYVRASVNAFGYDRSGNKGVSFGLNNVQFIADGERIAAGGSNPNSEFDDVEGGNVSEGDAGDLF